jgi:hypothetical protein
MLIADPHARSHRIRFTSYGPDQTEEPMIEDPDDLPEPAAGGAVRWIDIEGLGQFDPVRRRTS